MKKSAPFMTLIAVVLLAACAPKPAVIETVSVTGGTYRTIAAPELQNMLRDKDFVFVNVHTPFAGSIAGTDMSIPYDQIGQQLSLLPPDKAAKIVLYCRSGHMSTIAAETLVKLGYTNIWTLKGGMQAWETDGFPVQGQ